MTELQARMSSREFAEWKAYYDLEPWGVEYDAAERAQIAMILANAYRDVKKHKQPFGLREFMIRFRDRTGTKPATPDMLAQVKVINRMLGGKDLTDGDIK